MGRFPVLLSMATAVLVSVPATGGIREVHSGRSRSTHPQAPRLPLLFIENRGQVDPSVSHYLRARGVDVYFTSSGLMWALSTGGRAHAVGQEFLGARPGVRPVAGDRRETVFSWFRGPREEWRAGVPTFGTLVYAGIWPGIDMVLSAEPDRLKTLYRVAPGADPGRIRFAYRGATSVRLTPSRSLRVETTAGGFEDAAPLAYQERAGRRIPVDCSYELESHELGFRVGDWDPALPLLVDPSVTLYAGFLGGTGFDEATCVALDGAGNAFVGGSTGSSEATFPLVTGPDLTLNASPPDIYARRPRDAFVAKVRPDGSALVYCGYIGGDSDDRVSGIAVDVAGSAYLAGSTYYGGNGFPAIVGPDLTPGGDSYPAFVAKVRGDGTALDYCGYVDGSNVRGIAVDSAGCAHVTGNSGGITAVAPLGVGPDLSSYRGNGDALVAKVRADGTGFVYRGYIGGIAYDFATAIAVDGVGNAYVTGSTASNESTFPETVGTELATYGGGEDAFVAKVRADGSGLDYCAYIGGLYGDAAYGIAVDGAGSAYIVGETDSPEDTFPVAVGPFLSNHGDYDDAFVAKVRGDGTGLDYCGYVGGGSNDLGLAIAVDAAGRAYITGLTGSTEATFPVVGGPHLVASDAGTYVTGVGFSGAFVSRLSPDGSVLEYSGFLGPGGFGYGLGIAVDASGSACVAGTTASDELASPVSGAPGLAPQGAGDAFVLRLPSEFPPQPARSLGLSLTHGLLRASSFYWRDSLSIRGAFSVEGEPFPDGVDPRAGGFGFEFANPWTVDRLRILADDPGWKEPRPGVYTWRSPPRSFPDWKVRVDSTRGSFEVRTSNDNLGFDWRSPVTVYLSMGGASGADTRRWERPGKGYGRFRFPRGGGE